MLSENSNPQHERHITAFYLMAKELIREMVPEIVKQTLNDTYFDLWVKLRMIIEGKEVYFNDVADYIIKEIERTLKDSIK